MQHERANRTSATLGTSGLVAGMLLGALTVPACVAIYVGMGSPVAIPPAIAGVVAALAWLTRLRHGDSRSGGVRRSAFVLYISAMVALMVQYTEQWLAHLPGTVMRLFPGAYPAGVAYSELAMIAVFPLAASALFLFGALALYHRHPAGDGAAWLLFTWCLVSAVTPFAYAVLGGAGTHYVGGMLTAPLPAACGIEGLRRLAAAPAPALHAVRRSWT